VRRTSCAHRGDGVLANRAKGGIKAIATMPG
jgi:hypothetical protein